MDAAQDAGRFFQPLVGLVGGVANEAGDDCLDLFSLGELGEFYEGSEFGECIGIAHDRATKVEGNGASVVTKSADGVAADGGVGVIEREAVRGLVEEPQAVEGPERVDGWNRGWSADQDLKGLGCVLVLTLDQEALGGETPEKRG